MLVLLNGPAAVGKSTIAERLIGLRPLALNLDIDAIRGQLGRWLDIPTEAGLSARALAISMISTHLAAGHDVVVPQLLMRHDFIRELEAAAAAADATFVELALDIDRAEAASAFDARSDAPTQTTHRDAADLVERSSADDAVGDMYDALRDLLDSRPLCTRVPAPRDDIAGTLAAVRGALSEHGIEW